MSVLGTMMLRAGLLSEGQVAAVSEQAASRACSEVDAILELGLADEDTLVAFLASKLMIPRVRTSVLERVDQTTHSRLPAIVAWDHKCMPVSADELGNLTVVMADPTDPRAIEAIAQHTGAYLIRAVSTVSDLTRALERHYGPEYAVRERAARAAQGLDVAESSRPTELELTPIRDQPAPQIAAPQVAAPPVVPPRVAAPHEPAIGIPDDDDDVPVRVGHGVAEEIVSGPHEQAYEPPPAAPYMATSPAAPYVSQTPAAPYVSQTPAAPYVSTPSWSEPPPAAAPSDPEDDPHTRPTMVETHTPSRGPRRARAHTPWNPPLAGPGQTIPPQSPPPEPALPPEPEPEPEPQVAIPPVVIPEPTSLPIVPLSPEAFAKVLPQLEAVTDRDAVTTVLLDFLADGFDRVILFVHSHNELRGLDARGKDLLVEAVRQVRIPTTGASSFSEAIERGSPYFGPANAAHKIDQAFSQALGGIRGNVLLLPITLGNKVPLLLWAHGTSHPVDPRSINELSAAVSTAILRIIAAARRKG